MYAKKNLSYEIYVANRETDIIKYACDYHE